MDTWTVEWVAWGGTGVYLGIFALQSMLGLISLFTFPLLLLLTFSVRKNLRFFLPVPYHTAFSVLARRE